MKKLYLHAMIEWNDGSTAVMLQKFSFNDEEDQCYIEDYSSAIWVLGPSHVEFRNIQVHGSKGVMPIGVDQTVNFSFLNSSCLK